MRNFWYKRALLVVACCLERAQFPKQSWTLKLRVIFLRDAKLITSRIVLASPLDLASTSPSNLHIFYQKSLSNEHTCHSHNSQLQKWVQSAVLIRMIQIFVVEHCTLSAQSSRDQWWLNTWQLMTDGFPSLQLLNPCLIIASAKPIPSNFHSPHVSSWPAGGFLSFCSFCFLSQLLTAHISVHDVTLHL